MNHKQEFKILEPHIYGADTDGRISEVILKISLQDKVFSIETFEFRYHQKPFKDITFLKNQMAKGQILLENYSSKKIDLTEKELIKNPKGGYIARGMITKLIEKTKSGGFYVLIDCGITLLTHTNSEFKEGDMIEIEGFFTNDSFKLLDEKLAEEYNFKNDI